MMPAHRSIPRGLTLLELMLALVVTALIAGAISGMMSAVTAGVSTRRDNRSTMVGASAAAARLSAYVAPSCCILDIVGSDLVLWREDSRESGTVHATEIRWLVFNAVDGTYDVCFVSFPPGWSQAARDLEDNEYTLATNWMSVLSSYQSKGWIASMPLVDGLDSVGIATDAVDPLDSRHVNFRLGFATTEGAMDVCIASTIRLHETPSS
ncbi:MAG: prepilin-type N-terminal cleavage/methylation domain-containing protein [Planctomycetota bacterium]|nr:prepilin-type N-terminal cleavage/methylation domain-containing protein [Planctomycetota bacterium]